MKYLIILFLFFSIIALPQAKSISGKIIDAETKLPLPKANIFIQENRANGTTSDENGSFNIKGELSAHLVVTYVGYETKVIPLLNYSKGKELVIELNSKVIPSQSVLVKGSLGKEGVTPLAFSKIKKEEIEKNYTVQDIPEYLSHLPSTTFYSENGNGIGYNYLSIRGFDQRRISVSINGIPQNDPEDHNVYWLDFPDLLASTEVIQVQRGAGSGVFGYPAVGGSINIITSTFSNKPKFDLSTSLGSYNVRKYSASFSSGLIDNKYSIYANLSQTLSSGYRDNSWVKFNSYHISAVRYDKNLTSQINFYGGPISDGLAYTGLPKFAIKDKNLRRKNYSYWETDLRSNTFTYVLPRRTDEIENFSQPHFELLNEYNLNENVTFNSALFLVLGNGFFDYDGSWADTSYLRLTSDFGFSPDQNPSNVLIRAQVENKQYGWIPRVSFKQNNGELIIGGEFRIHRSTHWGSINFGENLPLGLTKEYRYYFFNGGNDILNGFIHETYNFSDKLNFLGEVQLAYHRYKLNNEKYIMNEFEVSNLFFNPRIGINYKFNNLQNLFISFARVSREPRLNNYYDAAESSGGATPQFELNSNGTYNFDQPLVKPETMNDIEVGSSFNKNNFTITANLFYMIFNNEIVKNGKLDRFGQPITGNVESTIHSGIELSVNLEILNSLEIFANATYSKNEINKGKTFIDYFVNDNSSEVLGLDLNGSKISGFPDFLANFGISFQKFGMILQLSGKYVGEFYSDIYSDKLDNYLNQYPGFVSYNNNMNDAYFITNFSGSYNFNIFNSLTSSKIIFQINNLFDNLYSANAIGAEFFPAAERNFLFSLQVGL